MKFYSAALAAVLLSITNISDVSGSLSSVTTCEFGRTGNHDLFGITKRKSNNLVFDGNILSKVVSVPRGGEVESTESEDELDEEGDVVQELYLPGLLDAQVAKPSAVSVHSIG